MKLQRPYLRLSVTSSCSMTTTEPSTNLWSIGPSIEMLKESLTETHFLWTGDINAVGLKPVVMLDEIAIDSDEVVPVQLEPVLASYQPRDLLLYRRQHVPSRIIDVELPSQRDQLTVYAQDLSPSGVQNSELRGELEEVTIGLTQGRARSVLDVVVLSH